MNTAVSQSDASARVSAYAVAQRARANWEQAKAMAAADRLQVQAQPAPKEVPTPAEIRKEVMADRGVDRRDLVALGPQARMTAEISIDAETARRSLQARLKSHGVLFDLKV